MFSSFHPESKPLDSKNLGENMEKIAPIECLPPELSLILLKSMPDLPTLSNLVHASPACRRIFQSEKRNILKFVIENELHPALAIEAKAVTKNRALCKVPSQGPQMYWETWCVGVQQFLEEWKDERKSFEASTVGGQHKSFGIIDKSDTIEMGHMWDHVRTLTAECYARLQSLQGTYQTLPKDHARTEAGMTKMEGHRIQRALYRIEVFTHLFRRVAFSPGFEGTPSIERRWRQMEILYFKSADIEEWEKEEFICVLDWMYWAHWDMLTEVEPPIVKADVAYATEVMERRRKHGYIEFPLELNRVRRDDTWKHSQCKLALMHGIPYLGNLLRAKSAKEKLAMMKTQLGPRLRNHMDFENSDIRSLHRLHQWEQRHVLVRTKSPMFDGDIVTGPNLAWSKAQHVATEQFGIINRYQWGPYTATRLRLCRWGYCLWDQEKFIGYNSGDWERYWGIEWWWREMRDLR